jgi:hypothetical protein
MHRDPGEGRQDTGGVHRLGAALAAPAITAPDWPAPGESGRHLSPLPVCGTGNL